MSIWSGLRLSALASTASLTVPSSIRTPPMLALKAIPTPQNELNATAATSPAHLVPCLLSPLSLGIGSLSLSLISELARGSFFNLGEIKRSSS